VTSYEYHTVHTGILNDYLGFFCESLLAVCYICLPRDQLERSHRTHWNSYISTRISCRLRSDIHGKRLALYNAAMPLEIPRKFPRETQQRFREISSRSYCNRYLTSLNNNQHVMSIVLPAVCKNLLTITSNDSWVLIEHCLRQACQQTDNMHRVCVLLACGGRKLYWK
jgi:hypothetical protein